MVQFFGRFDRKGYLRKRLVEIGKVVDPKGKVFVDIPAGPGGFTRILNDLGYDARPFDLLPEMFSVEGLKCTYADMEEGIPLEDGLAFGLICEEGIEHVSDQMKLLKEFNRVLKPGGRMFITTPGISSLRSKASMFLNEHQYFRRLPLSDFDSVQYSHEAGRTYFGHLFLISPQRLDTLANICGFRLVKFHANKVNWPSVLLGLFWPLIALLNVEAAFSESYRKRKLGFSRVFKVYWRKAKLNMSPSILFCKHTIAEFVKEETPEDRIAKLHQKHATEVLQIMESARGQE